MLALGREIDDSSPRNGLIYSPSDRRRTKVLKRQIGEGLAQLTLSLLGCGRERLDAAILGVSRRCCADQRCRDQLSAAGHDWTPDERGRRSEEHTSELQSIMRSSYAVICLKKKQIQKQYK